MPEVRNNKELVPFEHYAARYRETDPSEISVRTGLPFDPDRKVFTLTLMNSVWCFYEGLYAREHMGFLPPLSGELWA